MKTFKKLTLQVLGILGVSILIAVVLYQSQNKHLDSTDSVVTVMNYEVIDTEDTSYAGCKRLSVWVTLESEDDPFVQNTLNAVKDEYAKSYDDVSVFGYRESELDLIGNVPYTLGKSEISTCG